MRFGRFFPVLLACAACEPTGVGEVETVQLTLRLKLAGNRTVGHTPAQIYVYDDSVPVPRALAFPDFGERCDLATTPETICTFQVAKHGTISLVVSEPEPAVFVRFAPASPDDSLRDGRYVEFTGWTECAEPAERGLCVVKPASDVTIEANFQLMQQVSVYQVGAARVDFVSFAAAPTLRVPAQNYNVLDFAGCRRLMTSRAAPCDSVRLIGESPHHRITAYVPRQTIFGMFSSGGANTHFQQWDGDCIPSGLGEGICSIISPDVSGAPINITFRYTWWECSSFVSAISDRDLGGCVLRGEIARGRH
jgi:hypothetical protein